MINKSLIVKLGAIGDVATVLPAAWKLHQRGSRIDWLCGKAVAPLLSCYSWIHPIVVNEMRLMGGNRFTSILEAMSTWRKLIGSSYDLCAMLQYDRRYQILTIPVRARRSISLRQNERAFKLVSERYHAAEFERILCNIPDAYRSDSIAPVAPDRLPPNPLPRCEKIRIALAPGGARNLLRDDPQRRWPLESYIALAKLLLDMGYEVVLTGGPDDAWVERQFASLPVDSHIGKWQIPQTLAFYQSCTCVVTHDTGPLHLAGLTDCCLVGIFGPTAPSKCLPRRDGVVGLWGGENLACRPCYDGKSFAKCDWNGCMMAIDAQQVADAVQALISNPLTQWRVENR